MLRSRIKRYLPSPARIKSLPALRYFGARFGEPALWAVHCNAISRAAAIGLFCAYLPMPMEMLAAAFLAILWRANLPLSVALVWLSNPFTWVVLYAPPYWLGATLLGAPDGALGDLTIEGMAQQFAALWLGCLIFGSALGTLAYFAVRVVWRIAVSNLLRARRRRARRRDQTRT
ncbi:MAG: DUF2062 domain-containing protein [bacterium]